MHQVRRDLPRQHAGRESTRLEERSVLVHGQRMRAVDEYGRRGADDGEGPDEEMRSARERLQQSTGVVHEACRRERGERHHRADERRQGLVRPEEILECMRPHSVLDGGSRRKEDGRH